MNFFYTKEFEIAYVLTSSNVKISTYKYCKTKKTLSFKYNCLYAHRFVFSQCISPPKKEFFIY